MIRIKTFPNCRLHRARFICWRRTRCSKHNSKNGCLDGYHATKPRVTFVYVILSLSLTIFCYYTTNQAFFPICRGDSVRFTLWNEKARGFDVDEYERAAKPTVMALSSCWVKTYGGKTSVIYMRLKK